MISEAELNNLKKTVPLWEVVAERVPLISKEGKNYCFQCPFHEGDRNPSFKVTQNADGVWLYKCFGCNAGGNIFQFIERFDKISFPDAQEKVASLSEWDEGRREVDQTYKRMLEKNETLKTFDLAKLLPFEEALANSAAGLAWLKSRGLSLENAKNFHLGYTQSVESWAPSNRVARDGWILFPTIEGDQVVSLKYRSVKAKEFLRKPGMATALFNLKAVVPFDDVFLTEGEPDAVALAEAGYIAVALPAANTTLTPEMRDKVLRADTIYLAGDMDDVGKQAMNKLWAELGSRTYRIEWPDVKDANDYFLKSCGGDVEKFRAGIEGLKRKARATPLPFFYDLQESIRVADTSNPMENPRRMHFVQPTVDMMAVILPGSVVYSYATDTGSGKTTFWSEQLLNEAIKHNSVVVNYSCELSPDEYAHLVTAQLTGKDRLKLSPEDRELAVEKLKGAQFFVGYNPDANRIGQVLDSLEWAIRRLGANIVILDHINFLSRGEKDEYKAQSDAMQRIKNLAVKYLVIFIVIGQSRKSTGGGYRKASELSDGKGSEAMSSDAQAVYHIHRERIRDIDPLNPPSDLLKPETEIRLYKCRTKGPGAGFANLFFQGATGRFIEIGAPSQEAA